MLLCRPIYEVRLCQGEEKKGKKLSEGWLSDPSVYASRVVDHVLLNMTLSLS
jgi:hypothetical protein